MKRYKITCIITDKHNKHSEQEISESFMKWCDEMGLNYAGRMEKLK